MREFSDEELTNVSGGAAYIGGGCDGCGACLGECPLNAIYLDCDGRAHVNGNCIECGACAGICPTGALVVC